MIMIMIISMVMIMIIIIIIINIIKLLASPLKLPTAHLLIA
jgi:hypothetical protein